MSYDTFSQTPRPPTIDRESEEGAPDIRASDEQTQTRTSHEGPSSPDAACDCENEHREAAVTRPDSDTVVGADGAFERQCEQVDGLIRLNRGMQAPSPALRSRIRECIAAAKKDTPEEDVPSHNDAIRDADGNAEQPCNETCMLSVRHLKTLFDRASSSSLTALRNIEELIADVKAFFHEISNDGPMSYSRVQLEALAEAIRRLGEKIHQVKMQLEGSLEMVRRMRVEMKPHHRHLSPTYEAAVSVSRNGVQRPRN